MTFSFQEEDSHLPRGDFIRHQNGNYRSRIYPSVYKDVYISLGQKIGENAWVAKVQIKPLVRFIWLGAIIMFLAGLFVRTKFKFK